jgi:ferredoxin
VSALVPALAARYLELGSVRHDYPVVLLADEGSRSVAPLAGILDETLGRIPAPGGDGELLRRDIYRLEAGIKRLVEADPGRDLMTLWEQAATQLLEEIRDPDRRAALHHNLDSARSALPTAGGAVLPCEPQVASSVVQHVWRRSRVARSDRDDRLVDDLACGLRDALEAAHACSPAATSAEALRDAMGDEHAGGIDFETLSAILGGTRSDDHASAHRIRRLEAALRSMEAIRRDPEGIGQREHDDHSRPAGSCREAVERWRGEVERRVELVRAVRIASLELQNRYRSERHDPFFARFGIDQLTREERSAPPPVLLALDSDEMDDAERSALLEILAGDVPLKVLLSVRRLRQAGSVGSTPGGSAEWLARIGTLATTLDDVFVIQAAASQLPGLAPQLVAALRHPGPALLAIYTGPDVPADGVPSYLRCAAAAESRAFPSFVCDPSAGQDWGARLSLITNPQPDRLWPRHRLVYEDADGHAVEEQLAFTPVDFLALDGEHQTQFGVAPVAGAERRMMPVGDYLELPPDEAIDAVPYVQLVDDAGRLHRGVVPPSLVAAARRAAGHWLRLQQLAGLRHASPGEPPPQEAATAVPAQATESAAESPAAAEPERTEPAPAPAATAQDDGAPRIDSALCTTCDECIQRNAAMFAYNDAKQAFIKDPEAGSYRELVEAAENCPVCIIHPGEPRDAGEVGLDDLMRRAAAFG